MSPSWALRGPISFIGGGDATKAVIEQESIEVHIVPHSNPYSRKLVSIFLCSNACGYDSTWMPFL